MATARSAPGSSTRTPPATLTNTSAEASDGPPCRASTAITIASRLRSMPVATRRGGTISVGATSACTSTSSVRGLADEPGRRVRHLDQAAGAHLEYPDLAGRPEAVLERPQRAEAALPLALEQEDAVHQVLQDPRAGDAPLLGHVPHEQHRGADALADLGDGARGLSHLPYGTGCPRHALRVERLDRIDYAYGGSLGLERRQDRLDRGLGEHGDGQRCA